MTPEEQKDLEANKEKVAKIQDRTFAMAREVFRNNGDQSFMNMIGRGKQTIDQTVSDMVRQAWKEIDRVWADHLRKYPD